jgi:hypothetical protein
MELLISLGPSKPLKVHCPFLCCGEGKKNVKLDGIYGYIGNTSP